MIHKEKLMEMMDILDLLIAAQKQRRFYHNPKLANLPTMQVLCEILSEQRVDKLNTQYETYILLSSLINKITGIADLETQKINYEILNS